MSLSIGIHDDVRAADYHGDPCEEPSLSSSIAKILIDRTPRHAMIAHPKLNPAFEIDDDSKFDLGSVAHELILGCGGGYAVGNFDDWRTKDAKSFRIEALEASKTPVLAAQFERAQIMRDHVFVAVSAIPECDGLFQVGRAERVLIWRDVVGGALCRAMIDWQSPNLTDIWDVKTTNIRLDDGGLARHIVNMGYDLQSAFYLRGLANLMPELAGRFQWRWVFCETSEPFEVRIIAPSAEMLALGDRKASLAISKWARCVEADEWPGYPAEVSRIEPPSWAMDAQLAREMNDEDAI